MDLHDEVVQKREIIQKIRRQRIELIALGMALAKGHDRRVILDGVLLCDLQSELVHDALEAIREQDGAELRRILHNWGVEEIALDDLAGSLVKEIQRRGRRERAMGTMARIVDAAMDASVEEMKESLQKALDELSRV